MSYARRAAWLGLIVLASGAGLVAQPATPRLALSQQIDHIFKDRAYAAPRFGPARWLPDGSGYAIVERSAGGSEIVRYDAATGARTVTVAAARLVPPGETKGLDIADYAWSSDGTHLLIFTNTRKVWRENTRGDYWVLDVDGGRLRKVAAAAPEATLMFAKFSPDATRVAFVRDNNIYVERLADGAGTPLTADGSQTTINGTSDWVYEEELAVRDGFRWSPDGRSIAHWQFDTTGVGTMTLINDTDSLYPAVAKIPYPKAGSINSAVRVGVVSAEGGPTKWMQVPGDPRDNYIARIEWRDAGTLAIQHLNRLQNRDDLLEADARTGDVKRIFTDESKTWVDVQDVRWIDDGKAFLWLSERDGWRHLYRVQHDNGAATLVTKFQADVIGFAGVDEKSGFAYLTASPDNATQDYLYRARLDGSGVPERVTPADQPGSHAYTLAPGAKFAFHTRSRMDMAAAQDIVSLPDHRSLRPLTDTSALNAKLAPVLTPAAEFFKVDIGGGVWLDGWLLKPSTFAASRRNPVIVPVYGEPASTTVDDRWGGDRMLFHRALAEAGYLVVSFDNRGTPAPKGEAWRHSVYGAVGDLSSRDQAAAVRALAASRSHAWTPAASACGAGAAAARTRSTACSGRRMSSRSASPSRRFPISGSTTRSIRSATWVCRRPTGGRLSPRIAHQLRRGTERRSADRPRIRRRQRALPGHRAPRESPDHARQALRHHGLSEPHARDRRGRGDDGAHLSADRPVLHGPSAAGAEPDVVSEAKMRLNTQRNGWAAACHGDKICRGTVQRRKRVSSPH